MRKCVRPHFTWSILYQKFIKPSSSRHTYKFTFFCEQILNERHVGQSTHAQSSFWNNACALPIQRSELTPIRKISVKFSVVSPLVTQETYSAPRRAILKQHLFKRAKTGVRQVRNCIDFRGKPWKRGRAQRREKANKYANPKSHQVVFLLIRSVKLYRSVLIMKYLLTVFGEVCTVLYLEYCAITLNKLQTLNKKMRKNFIFYFQICTRGCEVYS